MQCCVFMATGDDIQEISEEMKKYPNHRSPHSLPRSACVNYEVRHGHTPVLPGKLGEKSATPPNQSSNKFVYWILYSAAIGSSQKET